MIRPEDSILILLAAGRSRRFGAADKLSADLGGRPVGLHVAETLAPLPFRERIAVVGDAAPDYAGRGYRLVPNDRPGEGMGRSLRLAMAAVGRDMAAVVVCLADMPMVTAGHVERLLAAADGATAVVASCDGDAAKPPAVFGAAWFDRLAKLLGDGGARDLIRGAHHVVAPTAELIDVDTPADLAAAAALIRGAARRSD